MPLNTTHFGAAGGFGAMQDLQGTPLRTTVARFGVAVAAVAAATVLALWLRPIERASISPVFYIAVLIGAWYGGLWPGLLSTALAGFVTAWIFIPPPDTL